jgi:hypothetical protein
VQDARGIFGAGKVSHRPSVRALLAESDRQIARVERERSSAPPEALADYDKWLADARAIRSAFLQRRR